MASPSTTSLPLTGDLYIDVMTNGYIWGDTSEGIYYSFSDGIYDEFWTNPQSFLTELNLIFGIFEYYLDVEFTYAGYFDDPFDAALAGSNINIAVDGEIISNLYGDNTLALGIFPNTSFAAGFFDDLGNALGVDDAYYTESEGDIYLNIDSVANSYSYTPGAAGFALLLHEIGHTLGLKHPHDDGGTDRPTFDEAGIGSLNIDWLTIMSYNDDYNWNDNSWDPATPMILDVIALQYLYGVNLDTNSGDDVHTFSSNDSYYVTIFDAGGTDTIDLSDYYTGAYVEMPNYMISDFQYAPFGLVTTMADGNRILDGVSPTSLNWVLGYIEEVIGSAFADFILGSDYQDTIESGNGNDEVFGGADDDVIDGGAGTDVAYFTDSFEDCVISFEGDVCIVETLTEGIDRLIGIETLAFNASGEVDERDVSELAASAGPTIVSLIPTDGATGVGATSNVIVTFSETIQPGEGTVEIRSGSATGPLIESFDVETSNRVTISGATLTLDPSGSFSEDTQYFVVFGSDAIEDLSGNAFSGTSTYDFTTGSWTETEGQFRLFASDGLVATVGGNAEVFGTNGFQDITIVDAPGTVSLDPSFNAGGDIVRLSLDADSYTIARSGSLATISDGDTVLNIPLGSAGIAIVFADGVRNLIYDTDSGNAMIGAQIFSGEPVTISAPADGAPLPSGENPDATGRAFLGTEAHAILGGDLAVYGTNEAERVLALFGEMSFDPSFNRGGDTIAFQDAATSFTAEVSGSAVVLESLQATASILVGSSGMTLEFDGDSRNLVYDPVSSTVMIDDQSISADQVALMAAANASVFG